MAKKKATPKPKVPVKKAGTPRKSTESEIENPFDLLEEIFNELEELIGPEGMEEGLRELSSLLHRVTKGTVYDFEDTEAYKKSGDGTRLEKVVLFEGELFCPDRIKDIFIHLGFEIEEVFDLDFIIDKPTFGKIFVRINPAKPIIRFVIPAIFRKKMALSKVQAWCCEVMSRFTTVRMCSEDNSTEVFMCIDFHYEMDLDLDQLMYAAECLSDLASSIYEAYPDILDSDVIAEMT